jgi:voltage-gated potassium channel
MKHLFQRFLMLGAITVAVLSVGTLGFYFIAGYPLFDALYMALITMTTVGYSELQGLNHAGRVFNIFYIILAVSVLFMAIGMIAQTIIEAELGDIFGKRRVRKMIDSLRNHYIVCGFGRVGRGAAAELKEAGVPLVIVDRNPDKVERAMRSGYLAVLADSTRDETFRDVQVSHARGLVAALATDADNVFAVISAKNLNPKIYIAARAAEEEAEQKLRLVGADSVIAPYAVTGVRLAQSLLKPHVRQFLDFTTTHSFGGLNVRIEQLEVASNSDLVSRSLAEARLRSELKVIVLAIRRADADMVFNPPADCIIRSGDYLIVMGEPEGLRRLEQRIAGA